MDSVAEWDATDNFQSNKLEWPDAFLSKDGFRPFFVGVADESLNRKTGCLISYVFHSSRPFLIRYSA